MEHPETNLINDYIDGSLSPEETRSFEEHLKDCLDCFETITWINILLERTSSLPPKISPPRNLWKDIHHELRDIRIKEKNIVEQEAEVQSFGDLKSLGIKTEPAEKKEKKEKKEAPPPPKIIIKKQAGLPVNKIILASAIFIVLIGLLYYFFFRETPWQAAKIKGDPSIGNSRFSGNANLYSNKLLSTDGNSAASLKIPGIGTVEVESNSLLKRTGEFQFELEHGTIKAVKKGAQDFLIIKVPSAEIKDFNLGGECNLTVSTDGNSLLKVQEGWMRITNINRESIVTPNYQCEIRKGVGPGIPYSFSASPEFIKAINAFSLNGDETAVPAILSQATKEDAVSLWHLLQKVDPGDKEKVLAVLTGFVNPPEGASKEEILKLNRPVLLQWLEEIVLQM
jgi:hypothetical protein